MGQKAIQEFLERTFSLEGRTAVVTGAAGGIGSKIAEALACAGADIALCDINMENLGKTGETIREKGGNAKPFVVDVTDTDSVSSGVREIIKEYGHIDILVNCAGINRREGLMDVSEETYDRIMDINLKGVFRVSRAVAPYMKEQNKGSIINIGSHNTGSILGGCSVYGATKCGVLSMTRSMAVEWAKYNNLSFVDCGCFVAQKNSGKRILMKQLVDELKDYYIDADRNIFNSLSNVKLNKVIKYYENGEENSFLDKY